MPFKSKYHRLRYFGKSWSQMLVLRKWGQRGPDLGWKICKRPSVYCGGNQCNESLTLNKNVKNSKGLLMLRAKEMMSVDERKEGDEVFGKGKV